MGRITKYCFTFIFTFISLTGVGQSILDTKVSLARETYPLSEYFSILRSKGIPISFSASKLRNVVVTHSNSQKLMDIFTQLREDQIIIFEADTDQIIVKPYTQKSYTINGVLTDAKSGEVLIGGTVQVVNTFDGVISNGYGFYSLTLRKGNYKLRYSHVGYKPFETSISLNGNEYLKADLVPQIIELEEIEVHQIPSDINVKSTIPSVNRININGRQEQIPYFRGEVDIVQNALLRPGISTIGEDASGFNIRGGAFDQNLILMDDAVIYNPSHFFGLISIFNPESVNNVRIMKGFMPPSYGGRVAGVLEVTQKDGNSNDLSISGGVGLPSARFMIEGPWRKGKSSFLFSARQSIFPNTTDFSNNAVTRDRFNFQDFNLKLNAKPNKWNTYYLSAYLGNDRNASGLSSVTNWGNRMVNFRWNHLFTPKLFSNVSVYISEYRYRNENQDDPGAFIGKSSIVDYSFKGNLTHTFNPQNEIAFGFSTIFHRLNPGAREPFDPESTATNRLELDKEHAFESALYLGHEADYGKIKLNYGLRYSMFHNLGSGTVFAYEEDRPISDETIADTLFFEKNKLIKFYDQLEPRLSMNVALGTYSSIKATYSKSAQYLHLLSNTLSPRPTDIWKISDTYISPTMVSVYSLGFYKNDHSNKWEFSAEAYYKALNNTIRYKSGADLIFNENIETELLLSEGRAYGFELYAKKRQGKLTGWISYTLSRAESNITEGGASSFVPENHDRLHDFSTSWNYLLSKRVSISSNFVLSTGVPVTLPTDKYQFEGNLVPHFDQGNTGRLPTYHRLDLSLQLVGKKRKKDGSLRKNKDRWVLTLYNVYARANTFSYIYQESSTPGIAEIFEYSVFDTIVPSITYNFKF